MTFQAIFYEGTNRIRFQYQEMEGQTPEALGISNQDNSIGLGNGGYNETYMDPGLVSDNYAIQFSTQLNWLTIEPQMGTLDPGMSEDLALLIDATDLENGSYMAQIVIDSNDPEAVQTIIPVELYLHGVSVEKSGLIPDTYSLKQNYPNLFNPSTSIEYGLPEPSDVNIVVYDILGRVRQEWSLPSQQPGWYSITWNGTDSQGASLAAGVYFARIQAGDFTETIKRVYLK